MRRTPDDRGPRVLLWLSVVFLPFFGGCVGALVGWWAGATFGSLDRWDDIRGFGNGAMIECAAGTALAPLALPILPGRR